MWLSRVSPQATRLLLAARGCMGPASESPCARVPNSCGVHTCEVHGCGDGEAGEHWYAEGCLRMTVEKGSGDPADQTPWQRRTVREGDGVDEADGT